MDDIQLDAQSLDNNFSTWYFVPFPQSKFFENMEDDDHVVPVYNQVIEGCFVEAEWAANGCIDE